LSHNAAVPQPAGGLLVVVVVVVVVDVEVDVEVDVDVVVEVVVVVGPSPLHETPLNAKSVGVAFVPL
jgi:hypothetical protein